ncbi:MAG: response regulator transcription factor [Gammaproteobacteria bacterium]|nr:response regulator transcription factor [Gammaproteobacteria bacterium]
MKVLLIDDHVLFRDGMQLVLAKLDEKIQVFNASSYEDALPVINKNMDLDLILLDLGLPGLSDIDALKAVRKAIPLTPVVILSSNDDGAKVQQILNSGAQGYIPKSTRAELLIRSLKLVLSGGIYIPPEILTQLDNEADNSVNTKPEVTDTPLTPRQYEVLGKLIHGYSNKEIGRLLDMAESTVRVHIAAILKELNVSNRTRAARVAVQKGWATVEREY